MAYGRSKALAHGAASRTGAAQLKVVASGGDQLSAEGSDELDTLRSINAHLLHELAALREREAQAQVLADRDGLTGHYNRRRMLELLQLAIGEAARSEECVGLLFIDLNGFKSINDEYGHAAGDKVLITAATRIAARVRNGDIVCRYGGDEFVVVLPSVPDAGAVILVADAIRERVSLPCWTGGNELRLTAAIGRSMYPHDGRTPDVLLHRADLAMYRAKTRLARPMASLDKVPHPRPLLRRRNDNSESGAGGNFAGGDP
ncbi:MAG: GGDEF domain-containing protein [Gammaproteobacteria bacterium]